jgi:hypothetical protein
MERRRKLWRKGMMIGMRNIRRVAELSSAIQMDGMY